MLRNALVGLAATVLLSPTMRSPTVAAIEFTQGGLARQVSEAVL